ncbi:hypothetical protein ACLHDF_27425 [Priestia aryabhattai]
MDKKEKESLPPEWLDLAKEAVELNVSQEDFKKFLAQHAEKGKK